MLSRKVLDPGKLPKPLDAPKRRGDSDGSPSKVLKSLRLPSWGGNPM